MLKNKSLTWKYRHPFLVEVRRNNIVESRHQVHVAIVNSKWRLVGHAGNQDYLTFPRSSIKMLQAIPLVESGAVEKFGLTDREIALACASHRGEKIHTELVQAWLQKMNLGLSDLRCGTHPPSASDAYADLLRSQKEPTSVHNNCSGKHCGFLASCLALGESTEGYLDYHHPLQMRLRQIMTEYSRVDHHKLFFGIDGCGIPTYAIPLQNLAMAMTAFLPSQPSTDSIDGAVRAATIKKILGAVTLYPELVAGVGDYVSEVIKGTQGRVILKNGAEGVMVGILPEFDLSFAAKAEDGGMRAVQAVATYLLESFEVLSHDEKLNMQNTLYPRLKNWAGLEVGSYSVVVQG